VCIYIICTIKSFVVQNFNQQYPFNQKTYRHLYAVALDYYKILLVYLLKTLVGTRSSNLLNYYYNIYVLYAYYITKSITSLPSNLLFSIKYFFLQQSTIGITIVSQKTPHLVSKPAFKTYLSVITHTSLNFAKNRLNQILYLNLFILVSSYFSYIKSYSMTQVSLTLNVNFYFLTFINLFYFKIRNY